MYSGSAAVLITVCIGFPLITLIINTAMGALVCITALAVRCDDAGGLYHGVDTVRAGCVPTDEICGSDGAD